MQYWCVFTLYILCLQCQNCLLLQCHSEQDNSDYAVHCTATTYAGENCSDSFLSGQYEDLYEQLYWPEKPDDLRLKPIQEEYDNTNNFYPGFIVEFEPPRSGSIQDVKGFQFNYEEELRKVEKCAIIILSNVTLNHNHRDNNLKIVVRLWPMFGDTNFIFTLWSLPKPPEGENDANQTRYGKTGKYHWGLTDATADWITTISYHNDLENKYIRIWFVQAPDDYHFLEYNVKLKMIISGEGTDEEHRDLIEENRISHTDYTFLNVEPGRYRVLVQPYDDKWDTLNDCKCKSKGGGCVQCAVTITSVIVVPTRDDVQMTSEFQSSTVTSSNSAQTDKQFKQTNKHVLPTVLAFVAFLIMVVVVVGIYLLHKERGLLKAPPESDVKKTNNNQNLVLDMNDTDTSLKCLPSVKNSFQEDISLRESIGSAKTLIRHDFINQLEFVPPTLEEIKSEDINSNDLTAQMVDINKDFLPNNDNGSVQSQGFINEYQMIVIDNIDDSIHIQHI